MKILVYGYGNPGRQDDGLGIFLAETIEKRSLARITVDTNYQLNAEDALLASEFDVVLFIDASHNDIPGHRLSPVEAAVEVEFTTHAMAPSSVIGLCEQLYDVRPASYLLEIRGLEWNIAEGLTDDAQANADNALAFLLPLLENPSLEAFASAATGVQNESVRGS